MTDWEKNGHLQEHINFWRNYTLKACGKVEKLETTGYDCAWATLPSDCEPAVELHAPLEELDSPTPDERLAAANAKAYEDFLIKTTDPRGVALSNAFKKMR